MDSNEATRNIRNKYARLLRRNKRHRLDTEEAKDGSGFVTLEKETAPQYLYWNDPNKLVERLALLHASKQSGNNNHDLEIASIVEELRRVNIIE